MNTNPHPVWESVVRNLAVISAWIMSIEAADVQMGISIVTGVLVGVYTAMNTFVLWRDRVKKGHPNV